MMKLVMNVMNMRNDRDKGVSSAQWKLFLRKCFAFDKRSRCDDRDNDCDGFVDEDFFDLGSWCEVGEGACKAEGFVGCAQSLGATTCLAIPYEPQAEVCDDVDNDCNGVVDDLVDPPSTPQHCGACGTVCQIPHAINRCRPYLSGRSLGNRFSRRLSKL